MYIVKWTKEKLLIDQEQVSRMSADEVARFIRLTEGARIIRNEDRTINRIVHTKAIITEA